MVRDVSSGTGKAGGADARSRPALIELRRITLAQPVRSDEGLVPAGAIGTIVHVWQDGASCEVEFTSPFPAVATVTADDVAA